MSHRVIRTLIVIAALMVVVFSVQDASASYAFYVGRNLTADGSVLIGGTGEEPSSHWLEIVPRKTHRVGSTITVGATSKADLPAKLSTIPQVRTTFRYLTMNYSSYAGFPAPLTNGGLNEYQVAVRDVWSPSRKELVEMTPVGQTGPNYSDLARLALERAKTARDAAKIIGDLIDTYGYTTYGGNSHLIADSKEGWIVIEYAGGKGLWVAERLGPDDIRVSYPGYIEDVPKNYQSNPDYMGSANLISFAVSQGWYDEKSGQSFNADKVYGMGGIMRSPGTKYLSPEAIEHELQSMVPVSVGDMMKAVRDPRIADDRAGYGQVVPLRLNLSNRNLAMAWVAPTGSVTAPFLPWWIGVSSVPPEFGEHRYLTENASSTFINPEFLLQEATEFAGRLFKRLLYFTCAYPNEYLKRVQATLTSFEAGLRKDQAEIERKAARAFKKSRVSGHKILTEYSHSRAADALTLGRGLVAGVESEIKARHGISTPKQGRGINAGGVSVNCLVGADPDRRPDQQ